MYTTIISLAVASSIFALCWHFFGLIGALLPALVALIATFFIISRKIGRRLERAMSGLQEDLLKGNIDKTIKTLKAVKKQYKNWQFFLGSTLDGQIGSIYYMKAQPEQAKPYLERAFIKHWVAKAMLAVIYYREKNFSKMNQVFEAASRYNKKSGLLWSLWAYCLCSSGENKKAINILAQGKGHLGDNDQILSSNLLLLQNQKKMKMKGYAEQWYQFQLELSPAQTQMRQGHIRFRSR